MSAVKKVPKGEEEPLICSILIWLITKPTSKKGTITCSIKNRFKVELLIENPPQTQKIIILPITGIAVIKLVITVAPHRLIWPQGSTYPKNAIPADKKKVINPETHKIVF